MKKNQEKNKNKVTNTQNVDNYEKREKLRIAIMIMSGVTIILALLSLTIKLGFGYALVSYLVTHVLISMRSKLEITESELVKTKREERLAKKGKKKNKKVNKSKKGWHINKKCISIVTYIKKGK